MSSCCSCTEVIPDGNTNRCVGCQKLIHSWCGAPCFEQNRNSLDGFEIGRACFPCYKGIYGVDYSPLNGNGLESNKENPLKRPFNYTDGDSALLSSFSGEVPLMSVTNIESSLMSLPNGEEINGNKQNDFNNKKNDSNNKQNTSNITLETYFEFSENRNDGSARCKICTKNKVITIKKYSYTSVKYHLERYHPEEFEEFLKFNPKKREIIKKEIKKTDFSSSNIQLFSKAEAIRYAVRYSASENLPFKCLENKFFQEIFQRSIRPSERKSYTGRKCFNKDFNQYYNETRLEKIKILSIIDSKISITTDIWNSPNQESFLGITAHWIDSKFNLHNMLLSFTPVKKLRTTAGMNSKIETCLKSFNIQNKILGISLDISAPNLNLMEQLNTSTSTSIYKKNQSPCLAHIFHLAAQAFVSTIKQEYSEIDEQPISFFYKITALLETASGSKRRSNTSLSVFEEDFADENMNSIKDNNFIFRDDMDYDEGNFNNDLGLQNSNGVNQCLDPISKLINALELLKSSPPRRSEFMKLQQFKDIKPSIVVLDIRTRWNSTFKLIEWAILNRDPLTYFMVQEKMIFTDQDWELLIDIQKFLTLFDEKTSLVTEQRFPTISKALLAFEEVLIMIKETNYPVGSILSKALVNCNRKLLKYANILKNDIHVMGTILDPSLKDTFYLAYNWPEKDKEEAKSKMIRIYEEYTGPAQLELNNSNTTSNSIKKPRAIAFRESIKPIVENELKTYLSDLSDLETENLLSYWKIRSTVFPTLGKIARDYLTVCATTIPIENEFSCTKNIFDTKKLNGNSEFTAKYMEMKSWELPPN